MAAVRTVLHAYLALIILYITQQETTKERQLNKRLEARLLTKLCMDHNLRFAMIELGSSMVHLKPLCPFF